MTPTEREALIALWAKVPECRPRTLEYEGTFFYLDAVGAIPDDLAAALARDAIVEYTIDTFPTCLKHANGTYTMHPGLPSIHPYLNAPTRLLALIAAAYAVAGVKQ